MRQLIVVFTVTLSVLHLISQNSVCASVIIDIASHERDGSVRDYGHPWTDAIEMAAGRAGGITGAPVPDNSGILFFELPSLAAGQAVLNASLRVTLFAAQNLSPNESVDLYALGYVNELPPEHNIDSSWYYSGALDTRTGDALGTNIGNSSVFLVADNFVTTSTPLGNVNTDATAGDALADFIGGLYDDHGAQGGDYLVLRLSANQVFNADYHRYRFYSRDNDDGATWPVLTLTAAVPEPASIAVWSLLCVVGFVIVRRRRRHA